MGVRAAGRDHDQARALVVQCGREGSDLDKELSRLLPLKTKAEYDPEDIPIHEAGTAVRRAERCVAIARRVVAARPSR